MDPTCRSAKIFALTPLPSVAESLIEFQAASKTQASTEASTEIFTLLFLRKPYTGNSTERMASGKCSPKP